MPALQPDLQNRLRNELLRCRQFSDNENLRAVFADSRLTYWQYSVPEAATPASRVSFLISQFMDAWNSTNNNGLALVLLVLSELNDNTALYSLAGEVQATLVRGKIAECERELTQVKEHQARGWSDPAYAQRRTGELQGSISQWNLKLEEGMAFNQGGQKVKYQVNMTGTAVGVIGDGATINGGLNMGGDFKRGREQQTYNNLLQEYDAVNNKLASSIEEVQRVRLRRQLEHLGQQITALAESLGISNPIQQESVTMVNFSTFDSLALNLQAIRDTIALRKEFGLTVPESLLDEGRRLRRQVEAAAAAEKETYAANLKRELRDVETAEEKRARLNKELAELGNSTGDI